MARVRLLAEETGDRLGLAVQPLDDRPPVTIGPLQVGAAWSTMKVPVVLARYRLAQETGQRFAELDTRVVQSIVESDNEAADSLFEEIVEAEGGVAPASRYVQQVLEDAGDPRTVVNTTPPPAGFSTFGQTRWGLAQGARFYSALARGCLAPASASEKILRLMGEIDPSQRWGIGQARFRGVDRVLFKGGWGPDPSGRYLVRQFAIVEGSGGGLAIGVIDMPADGSFESGVSTLNRLTDAVAESVRPIEARIRRC